MTILDSTGAHLAKVAEHNAAALDTAAQTVLDCVLADGLLLTAGAGHSLAAVAETFYRAGGLACVKPLYHPDLLPMHGAMASTKAERRAGLAAEVLGTPGAADVLVVFSTSGVNPYPVELAKLGRAADRPVIGVTSGPASSAAPLRAGTRVAETASIVLDTLVPPGDATYPADESVTAPVSTVVNAFLWNLLLGRVLDLATDTGVTLPLWRSSNVPGGDEANAGLFARFTPRVPALRG
ncbi:MAG TPA: sugar isomerase domain-containing protein [Pseudonocardiaceae bacterium]|jgi:uncharacterized phosphosugar-binding protein|nr:sugar isomerase domain-containing protein [Pseudonocardiaceae bacterium]